MYSKMLYYALSYRIISYPHYMHASCAAHSTSQQQNNYSEYPDGDAEGKITINY